MALSTPQDVAQRLYDQADIHFLEKDRPQLNAWADLSGALDVLVDEKGPVDFTNIGVGRGRALWILIAERRPDLLVSFLAKVAGQAMMVPHNVIRSDTLLDERVRRPLVEWLTQGPDPDPVLGLIQAKEVCLLGLDGKADINSSEWTATLGELVSTFSLPQQQSQLLMWLGELYHGRLRTQQNIDELEQKAGTAIQTLIGVGLDLQKPVEHENLSNGARGVKAKNPSAFHGLGHLYAQNNYVGGVLLDVALTQASDLNELLDNPHATPEALDGLRKHPTVRRKLLEEYIVPGEEHRESKRHRL